MNSLFLRVIGAFLVLFSSPSYSVDLEWLAQSSGDGTLFILSRAPGGPFDTSYNAPCNPSGPWVQAWSGTVAPVNPAIPTRFSISDQVRMGRWCWQVTQQETSGFTDAAVSNVAGANLSPFPMAPSNLGVAIQ